MALHSGVHLEPGQVQGWEVEFLPDHHSWAPAGRSEGHQLVGTTVETVLKGTAF